MNKLIGESLELARQYDDARELLLSDEAKRARDLRSLEATNQHLLAARELLLLTEEAKRGEDLRSLEATRRHLQALQEVVEREKRLEEASATELDRTPTPEVERALERGRELGLAYEARKANADRVARELLMSEQAERDRAQTKRAKKRLNKKNRKLDKECIVCMTPRSIANPFVRLGTCDHARVCKACAAEMSERTSAAVCPICNV